MLAPEGLSFTKFSLEKLFHYTSLKIINCCLRGWPALGRAVFPGASVTRKRGMQGELREISLGERDGLVCVLLVPCVRTKGCCWGELCGDAAGLCASGVWGGWLSSSFRSCHLVPRCILLEACLWPKHIFLLSKHISFHLYWMYLEFQV